MYGKPMPPALAKVLFAILLSLHPMSLSETDLLPKANDFSHSIWNFTYFNL